MHPESCQVIQAVDKHAARDTDQVQALRDENKYHPASRALHVCGKDHGETCGERRAVAHPNLQAALKASADYGLWCLNSEGRSRPKSQQQVDLRRTTGAPRVSQAGTARSAAGSMASSKPHSWVLVWLRAVRQDEMTTVRGFADQPQVLITQRLATELRSLFTATGAIGPWTRARLCSVKRIVTQLCSSQHHFQTGP